MVYSDWIIEHKNIDWDFYWLDRLQELFLKVSKQSDNINIIYNKMMDNIVKFTWTNSFQDDASILLIKRNTRKDIVDLNTDYIKKIKIKEKLNVSEVKKLKWKTIEYIEEEMKKIKKKKEISRIIKSLEILFYNWEFLKLKQESIRFTKEWYIDKKINYFLKKAIANEQNYKINQKNSKLINKYNILRELFKKWDYETVIKETEEIIEKDGNI